MTAITDLNELLRAMKSADAAEFQALGLPVKNGALDWTALPTFGGDEPVDTSEVWSWDETRLIVGTCADDVEIVSREAWAA